MKAIKQKIIKLEKDKILKTRKRDTLNLEISQLESQLKELKNIDRQYEKIEQDAKKLLKDLNKKENNSNKNSLENLIKKDWYKWKLKS